MNIVKINTKNIAYTWPAFLMIIPTFVLLVIFSYMPAFDAVRCNKIFFQWCSA